MKSKTIRRWSFVHTWTSLICTVFLLMLALTGLPLIFHHEIDHLLGDGIWDALSWLGLGIPAALALRGLLQRR